jgi:hypothetical protein
MSEEGGLELFHAWQGSVEFGPKFDSHAPPPHVILQLHKNNNSSVLDVDK